MILAGDVGGTKVNLALFDEQINKTFKDEQKFPSRDFPQLSALLKKYLESHPGHKISAACFGVAGPVREGKCQATNLPWVIVAKDLERELNIPKVYLINDLEANAWGLRCLADEEFFTVNLGSKIDGNQALVSAGTGLGEAGLYWDGKSHQPFACEGGHCDFGPTNEEEIELLRFLMRQFKHVSYERILSGSGIYELYRFLIETKLEKEDPAVTALLQQKEPQRVVVEKGASGESKACMRACRLFTSIYAAEAANSALKFMAVGGVFLGGGIAPHLIPFFRETRFIESFISKGRFASFLMKIPIKIVLNENTALLGAARYAQER